MTNSGKPRALSFMASSSSPVVPEGGSSNLRSRPIAIELPPDPLHFEDGPSTFVGDFREYFCSLGQGYQVGRPSFPVLMGVDDAFLPVGNTSVVLEEASTTSSESELLDLSPMDRVGSNEPRDGSPGVSFPELGTREGVDPSAPWANILDGRPF